MQKEGEGSERNRDGKEGGRKKEGEETIEEWRMEEEEGFVYFSSSLLEGPVSPGNNASVDPSTRRGEYFHNIQGILPLYTGNTSIVNCGYFHSIYREFFQR